jgi:hypothetical protein
MRELLCLPEIAEIPRMKKKAASQKTTRPLRSMTGFGRGESRAGGLHVIADLTCR